MGSARAIPVGELARQLRAHVRGEVGVDVGARALYATDAPNYRQHPPGTSAPLGRPAKDDS